VPVAGALAWVLVSEYPLRDMVLAMIDRCCGIKRVYWFVSVFLPGHSISTVYTLPPDPKFTLILMCVALVAMHVQPRRFRWWEYVVVVAWGLVCPIVFLRRPICRV